MTAQFEVELVGGPMEGKTDTIFSIALGEYARGRSVAVITYGDAERKDLERRFFEAVTGLALVARGDTVLKILKVAQLEEGCRPYHTLIVDAPQLSPRNIAMIRAKANKVIWVAYTDTWHWRKAR